ncbi:hypothetical protein Vadar_011654 [Vaccinium darrowii]|uniref:Uncharacterized protein n=1 Tax=Vaccinium darrowii TaxID=229202 RepID=A0ACB7Y005_9ERIC|nr:hypothetical protein Vadar_011654 [Vaccinium darrowii]
MDPQYFMTRRLTKNSNVYAFGVLLFEVLCARPPVDFGLEEEQCSLAHWAQNCIKQGTLDQIIDPSLRGEIPAHGLKVFAELANRCLHNHPKGRPTVAEVVDSLVLMLDSQGNSTQRKGITAKMLQSILCIVAKCIHLGWKNWMKCSFKKGLAEQFQGDQLVDNGIQLYRRYSLAEIQVATNNFHEQLVVRQGGDIKVYRGHIAHGNLKVLIKRIERTSGETKVNQLRNAIQVLYHLRHLNILSLIGYCNEKNEMILIHENVAIWSLYHCLYKTNIKPLLWEKRTEICIGAARGLQYLHVGTKQTIIHQNLQSTRILLDKNWVAKVAGFEFARMLSKNEPSTSSNTFVVDNAGYMAPEYLVSAKFTEKSDVYSYGVSLLEVLFEEIAPECLKEYVILAEKCLRDEGIERPSMDDILSSLISALQLQDNWRNVEAVPRSHSNTLFDSAANVDKVCNKGSGGMNSTSFVDSDYFSANLAQ